MTIRTNNVRQSVRKQTPQSVAPQESSLRDPTKTAAPSKVQVASDPDRQLRADIIDDIFAAMESPGFDAAEANWLINSIMDAAETAAVTTKLGEPERLLSKEAVQFEVVDQVHEATHRKGFSRRESSELVELLAGFEAPSVANDTAPLLSAPDTSDVLKQISDVIRVETEAYETRSDSGSTSDESWHTVQSYHGDDLKSVTSDSSDETWYSVETYHPKQSVASSHTSETYSDQFERLDSMSDYSSDFEPLLSDSDRESNLTLSNLERHNEMMATMFETEISSLGSVSQRSVESTLHAPRKLAGQRQPVIERKVEGYHSENIRKNIEDIRKNPEYDDSVKEFLIADEEAKLQDVLNNPVDDEIVSLTELSQNHIVSDESRNDFRIGFANGAGNNCLIHTMLQLSGTKAPQNMASEALAEKRLEWVQKYGVAPAGTIDATADGIQQAAKDLGIKLVIYKMDAGTNNLVFQQDVGADNGKVVHAVLHNTHFQPLLTE